MSETARQSPLASVTSLPGSDAQNIERFLKELETSRDGREPNKQKLAALALRILISGEGVIIASRIQDFFTAMSGGNEEVSKALTSEYSGILLAILKGHKDRLNER